MTPQTGKTVDILLVEDNPGDVEIIREALTEWKVRNHLSVTIDGADALRFLRQQPPHDHSPRPDLVLLDLNLPKKSGREVLAEVKSDDNLKIIPVIVLTSSSSEEDIAKSYELHANSYIKKPLSFDQLLVAIKAIEEFWFTIANLPPKLDQ